MRPLISVIVPAYNLAFCIADTLASLIAQTWRELEIVFVDDASEDDTLQIAVKVLSNSNWQHKIIVLAKRAGVSHARNKGLEAASGDFVTFLDGDDLLDPQQIESLYASAALEQGAAEITICGYRTREAETGAEVRKPLRLGNDHKNNAERIANLYLLGKISPAISIMFKKDFLAKNGIFFSEDCHAGEDGEFIAKAMSVAHRIAVCENTGYVYTQHDRMGSRKKSAVDRISRYEDHTNAQEGTAAFILQNCPYRSTKKIARTIIMPRVCQRKLSAYAMRGDRDAFDTLRSKPETTAALKEASGSFREKPEVFLKSMFLRLLPGIYYRHYRNKIDK